MRPHMTVIGDPSGKTSVVAAGWSPDYEAKLEIRRFALDGHGEPWLSGNGIFVEGTEAADLGAMALDLSPRACEALVAMCNREFHAIVGLLEAGVMSAPSLLQECRELDEIVRAVGSVRPLRSFEELGHAYLAEMRESNAPMERAS